ncbi:MAG: GNAT family N-acetyltransferase [Chlamydiae bacterium]|nr:GNAT family N-acetyltransferase [Chlamydiota bacterium]
MKNNNDVIIRQMTSQDIESIITIFCFPWTTIEKTIEKWKNYYEEQNKNIRFVAVVEKKQQLVGYASLLSSSEYPHFKKANIPEINDLWVLKEHRRKGIGKRIIAYLENQARREGFRQIGIGVGLYEDYGPAQNLYGKLGYLPDGSGITYKHLAVVAGEKYPVDDDLVLWLTKTLS